MELMLIGVLVIWSLSKGSKIKASSVVTVIAG